MHEHVGLLHLQSLIVERATTVKYNNNESRKSQDDIAQLKNSVSKGDPVAEFKLAYQCYKDNVDHKYNDLIVELLIRSESKGNLIASVFLGYLYQTGEIVEKNYCEALDRYRNAAHKVPQASYYLAQMYESGHGVIKDIDKAIKLYRKISQKYPPAIDALKKINLRSPLFQDFGSPTETKVSSTNNSSLHPSTREADEGERLHSGVDNPQDDANVTEAPPLVQWGCHEPEPGQKWAKEHHAHKCEPTLGLYYARRRGRSHEHDAKFCDDDGDFWQHASGWTVLAVADGAGSAAFSREGSRLAITTVIEEFQQWFTDEQANALDVLLGDWQEKHNTFYQLFYYKYYDICRKIITKINALADIECTSTRQFATTLLVTVSKTVAGKTYLTSLWIGDGAIVAYLPSASRLLGAADSGTYVGQTRFLDASYLQQHFTSSVYLAAIDQVEALLLMTDGVSDPKFKSDADLNDERCWDDFWQEIAPELAKDMPDLALLEWLHFFERGYHDDRTLLISRNQEAKA